MLILQLEKSELESMIALSIERALSANKPQEVKFLTRREVCKHLHISLPTLHAWLNKGLIKSRKIGSRTLFDLRDIEASVSEKRIFKYKHWRD